MWQWLKLVNGISRIGYWVWSRCKWTNVYDLNFCIRMLHIIFFVPRYLWVCVVAVSFTCRINYSIIKAAKHLFMSAFALMARNEQKKRKRKERNVLSKQLLLSLFFIKFILVTVKINQTFFVVVLTRSFTLPFNESTIIFGCRICCLL